MAARRGQGVRLLDHPGLLAAGAAALAAAALALWAFRGLPLGAALLWVAPLPLFLAGLGFGAGAGTVAALLATLLVAVAGGGPPALAFLALFGLPVPLLVAAALRGPGGGTGGGGRAGGRLDLSVPLALLGAWPVSVLLAAALFAGGDAGGLEGTLRRAVEATLGRMGVQASDAFIGTLARLQAAALGFWAGLALVATGAAAQGWLSRRGLARAAAPGPAGLRLPAWYPWLPAAAAVLLLAVAAAGAGGDAVPLSALLLLLVPPFYLGVAGVHARARGLRGRAAALALFYVLLVVFLQLMAPAMVALGLFDHFRRRGGSGAAPTRT